MKLRDVVPQEFFSEFMETSAAKHLDVTVVKTYKNKPFPGSHKNVHVWWLLSNGKAIGWNESPSRGWSFPVVKH